MSEIKTFEELVRALQNLYKCEIKYINNNWIKLEKKSIKFYRNKYYFFCKAYTFNGSTAKSTNPQKIYNVTKAIKECEDEK